MCSGRGEGEGDCCLFWRRVRGGGGGVECFDFVLFLVCVLSSVF